MRPITTLAIAVLAGILGLAGTATDSKTGTSAKKTPAPSAKSTGRAAPAKSAPKAATAKATPAKTTASTSKKSSKTAPKQTAARYQRSAQQQPTSDRYKEIQQALSQKGYFAGSADGIWGADSVEALKRFQRDQNLTDDGKIGSLSLIALGLGPKHEANATPLPSADKTTPR